MNEGGRKRREGGRFGVLGCVFSFLVFGSFALFVLFIQYVYDHDNVFLFYFFSGCVCGRWKVEGERREREKDRESKWTRRRRKRTKPFRREDFSMVQLRNTILLGKEKMLARFHHITRAN